MNLHYIGWFFKRAVLASLLTTLAFGGDLRFSQPAQANVSDSNYDCQFSTQDIEAKENLRQAAFQGSQKAQQDYNQVLTRQAQKLRDCRAQSWLHHQSIWLRMYPCDAQEGKIDDILDRIVNRGYNEIYLGVFYSGQVLLPSRDNSTVWTSVEDRKGKEDQDLLDETIQKAHLRGLKVYAWLFSLNYGYIYWHRLDRQSTFARNGKGENSLDYVQGHSQLFVDPYNQQVREDYQQLLELILQRKPDGVLFDYIRYPRGEGSQSVAGNVKDLWIYGDASKAAFLNRATNGKGRFLLGRYLSRGDLIAEDLQEADKNYPQESSPLWQGRNPPVNEMSQPLNIRLENLRNELWFFAVAHAAQGVVDFLTLATKQVQAKGISSGAVFFPEGNQPVGQRGFDSRLQPWDHFPKSIEWHPMSYGLCENPDCIVQQVKRVLSISSNETPVIPAIAGIWGKNIENRPSLENQMAALRLNFPTLDSISHFAFSWQEPEFDKARKFCRNY
jgi:hypothetical protein